MNIFFFVISNDKTIKTLSIKIVKREQRENTRNSFLPSKEIRHKTVRTNRQMWLDFYSKFRYIGSRRKRIEEMDGIGTKSILKAFVVESKKKRL